MASEALTEKEASLLSLVEFPYATMFEFRDPKPGEFFFSDCGDGSVFQEAEKTGPRGKRKILREKKKGKEVEVTKPTVEPMPELTPNPTWVDPEPVQPVQPEPLRLPQPTPEQLGEWRLTGDYEVPKDGQRYWSIAGGVHRHDADDDAIDGPRWIVVMRPLSERLMPTPAELGEDYELIGEFREPKVGEIFFSKQRRISAPGVGADGPRHILRMVDPAVRVMKAMTDDSPFKKDVKGHDFKKATFLGPGHRYQCATCGWIDYVHDPAFSCQEILSGKSGTWKKKEPMFIAKDPGPVAQSAPAVASSPTSTTGSAVAASAAQPKPTTGRKVTMAKLFSLALVGLVCAASGAWYATPKPPAQVEFEQSENQIYLESFKRTHAKCEQEGHNYVELDKPLPFTGSALRCMRCGGRA